MNTAGKAIVLRSLLPPPYNEITVEPRQSFKYNITVTNRRPFIISLYDAVTNLPTSVDGKSTVTVFPNQYVVPYPEIGMQSCFSFIVHQLLNFS